jgi:hypothetical protein
VCGLQPLRSRKHSLITRMHALTRRSPAPTQEQAAALQRARPALDAAGFRLVIIGVGTPASGRTFCAKLTPSLAETSLFVDPSREVYETLGLYKGLARTFLNKATPAAISARGTDGLKEAAKNYTMIPPPKGEDALQQGGLLVLDGASVLFAWRDEGTADHAPIDAVLGACCAGAAAALA